MSVVKTKKRSLRIIVFTLFFVADNAHNAHSGFGNLREFAQKEFLRFQVAGSYKDQTRFDIFITHPPAPQINVDLRFQSHQEIQYMLPR